MHAKRVPVICPSLHLIHWSNTFVDKNLLKASSFSQRMKSKTQVFWLNLTGSHSGSKYHEPSAVKKFEGDFVNNNSVIVISTDDPASDITEHDMGRAIIFYQKPMDAVVDSIHRKCHLKLLLIEEDPFKGKASTCLLSLMSLLIFLILCCWWSESLCRCSKLQTIFPRQRVFWEAGGMERPLPNLGKEIPSPNTFSLWRWAGVKSRGGPFEYISFPDRKWCQWQCHEVLAGSLFQPETTHWLVTSPSRVHSAMDDANCRQTL